MILTASAAWAWGGSGTANDPYTIESIEDMNQIVESIDAGNSYDGRGRRPVFREPVSDPFYAAAGYGVIIPRGEICTEFFVHKQASRR